MVNIKTVLVRKAEWLDELINNKQRRIESAPEGRLVIDSSKGNPQYYCVSDNGRQYISVKQHDLICALSQKDYDYRIIKAAGQEKALIKKILGKYPEKTVETVFADLRRERQKLVTPIVPTKEEMIRQFRAQAFEPHPIPVGDTGLETDRGEIVRTRAEYIIANEIVKSDAKSRIRDKKRADF